MNRGFSFLEVLVVTAILVLALGAVFSIAVQSQRSFQSERQMNEATQQARLAFNQIIRYTRQAGNDPFDAMTVPPIEILGSGHVRINSDVTGSQPSVTGNAMERTGDPDGLLNSIHERVTVRHHPGSQTLFIDVGYGEEATASGISGLEFTFLDRAGLETSNGFEVAEVRIEMVAETPRVNLSTGRVNSITLASSVFLRSKSFELFAD
jgi:prepilin-type N-terminal cleavage/methylation domain-containing protein